MNPDHFKQKKVIFRSQKELEAKTMFRNKYDHVEYKFFSHTQKLFLISCTALLILFFHYKQEVLISATCCVVQFLYFLSYVSKASLFLIGRNIKCKNLPSHTSQNQFLPKYSLIIPLYREARVLPKLVQNLLAINYPKSKLQILITLEEDDQDTIRAYRNLSLPKNFRLIIVPESKPKTKPKACNYALQFATGKFVTIYDAEDSPEPNQLLHVLTKFKQSEKCVACIQARLTYYNARENILTYMFYIEYTILFDYLLPALEALRTIVPLGGTSNHFKTNILKKMKWDAFNVTEDAEIAVRLKKHGYQIATLNSYTFEESPIHLTAWVKQRTRWTRGFLQTYFKHIRHQHDDLKLNFKDLCVIHIFFLLPTLSSIGTILHLCFMHKLQTQINSMFMINAAVFTMTSALQGWYILKMHKTKHHLFLRSALYPFYLLLQTVASLRALWQIMLSQSHWEKTSHDLTTITNTRGIDLD